MTMTAIRFTSRANAHPVGKSHSLLTHNHGEGDLKRIKQQLPRVGTGAAKITNKKNPRAGTQIFFEKIACAETACAENDGTLYYCHMTAGARNPRNLLTSRIPVLLQVLQVLGKESASDVENHTAESIYKNAEPRM